MEQNLPNAVQNHIRSRLEKIVDIENYVIRVNYNRSESHVSCEIVTNDIIGAVFKIEGLRTHHPLIDITDYTVESIDHLTGNKTGSKSAIIDTNKVLRYLDNWISKVNSRIKKHKTLLEEQLADSPLEEFIKKLNQFKTESQYEENDEFFNEEEIKQLVNKLDQLETDIIEKCNPTKDQIKALGKRKKRLISLLPKLTKKEWFMVCIGHLPTILKLLGEGAEKATPYIIQFFGSFGPHTLPPEITGFLPIA